MCIDVRDCVAVVGVVVFVVGVIVGVDVVLFVIVFMDGVGVLIGVVVVAVVVVLLCLVVLCHKSLFVWIVSVFGLCYYLVVVCARDVCVRVLRCVVGVASHLELLCWCYAVFVFSLCCCRCCLLACQLLFLLCVVCLFELVVALRCVLLVSGCC